MGKTDAQPGAHSLTPIGEARSALKEAGRELRYSPDLAAAARAIVTGWQALRRCESHDAATEGPAQASASECAAWRESLARVMALAETGIVASGCADPAPRLDLSDQVDWLSRSVAYHERSQRAGLSWQERVRRPAFLELCGLAAVAALAFAALCAEPPTERPWRAAFHRDPGLAGSSGDVGIRQVRRLDLDWGGRSPLAGFPADEFSVRFDSCLRVPQGRVSPTDLHFQLSSRGSVRLWLDGVLLLGDWGRPGSQRQAADAALSAGLHHLRVDYRNLKGSASITLAIEQANGVGRNDWLVRPPEPFLADAPCGRSSGQRP